MESIVVTPVTSPRGSIASSVGSISSSTSTVAHKVKVLDTLSQLIERAIERLKSMLGIINTGNSDSITMEQLDYKITEGIKLPFTKTTASIKVIHSDGGKQDKTAAYINQHIAILKDGGIAIPYHNAWYQISLDEIAALLSLQATSQSVNEKPIASELREQFVNNILRVCTYVMGTLDLTNVDISSVYVILAHVPGTELEHMLKQINNLTDKGRTTILSDTTPLRILLTTFKQSKILSKSSDLKQQAKTLIDNCIKIGSDGQLGIESSGSISTTNTPIQPLSAVTAKQIATALATHLEPCAQADVQCTTTYQTALEYIYEKQIATACNLQCFSPEKLTNYLGNDVENLSKLLIAVNKFAMTKRQEIMLSKQQLDILCSAIAGNMPGYLSDSKSGLEVVELLKKHTAMMYALETRYPELDLRLALHQALHGNIWEVAGQVIADFPRLSSLTVGGVAMSALGEFLSDKDRTSLNSTLMGKDKPQIKEWATYSAETTLAQCSIDAQILAVAAAQQFYKAHFLMLNSKYSGIAIPQISAHTVHVQSGKQKHTLTHTYTVTLLNPENPEETVGTRQVAFVEIYKHVDNTIRLDRIRMHQASFVARIRKALSLQA